jgi:hypothetical protein
MSPASDGGRILTLGGKSFWFLVVLLCAFDSITPLKSLANDFPSRIRHRYGRVQLTDNDRRFFIQLYRWFPSVLNAITIVQPETLLLSVPRTSSDMPKVKLGNIGDEGRREWAVK